MDYSALSDTSTLTIWLEHYGSFVLFGLLALGIILAPIPDESLMVFAGILLQQEKLALFPTLIAAYAGAMAGITTSYFLGRVLDKIFIKKYGSWVGLNHERWDQVHDYFVRYGKWLLLFGYYIPGVRHFSGLLVGVTRLHYLEFAPFAYTGAFIWTTTFLSLGYFFGEKCLELIHAHDITFTDIVVTLVVIYCLYLIVKLLLKE